MTSQEDKDFSLKDYLLYALLYDFSLGDMKKMSIYLQIGHWQQAKAMTPQKSSLVNQCIYWGYIKEDEWGVTIRASMD